MTEILSGSALLWASASLCCLWRHEIRRGVSVSSMKNNEKKPTPSRKFGAPTWVGTVRMLLNYYLISCSLKLVHWIKTNFTFLNKSQMRKSQVQNSSKLKVLLRGNFLCTQEIKLQRKYNNDWHEADDTRRHHPFILLGKDRRWTKRGRDIQQAGSSLLHGFLLPVCHLEGWGRLSPLHRNLCSGLSEMPQAQSPLLHKLHLSDAVDGTVLGGSREEFFPLGQKPLRPSCFLFLSLQNYGVISILTRIKH